MPPRWIGRACLIALLVGLALVVIGPMVVYAVAAASVDATLTPDQLNDPALCEATYQQNLALYRGYFLWTIPLAMGLIFSGVIGLLFTWVTRVTTRDPSRP